MKLLIAPPSPYSRKVRVLARELRMELDVVEVAVHTTPIDPASEVTAANPLSKIPTLITNDGKALYDSRVICEYLLAVAARKGLALAPNAQVPGMDSPGEDRWESLRRQALADGILDAGLAHRYETVLRPKELHWPAWLNCQKGKIANGLAALADDLPRVGEYVGLDSIAIACSLGWLEFRMPDIKWRDAHPSLASFFNAMSKRPSMLETQP